VIQLLYVLIRKLKDSKGTKGYLSILGDKVKTMIKNKEDKEAEIERINSQ